ncbi:hypothetical protein BXY51_006115 [Actinoplanes cyaneus]|nr:hypothetical protein [Actinoplanes cyaneus]
MVAQMSLFSRGELAGMRDRTLARNYSAEAEKFRRDHERHRAWGLRQRHARKLVRAGWGASAAWAAVTAGEDQPRQSAPVIAAPSQPARPAASASAPAAAPSVGRSPGETPLSSQHVSGATTPSNPQLAPSSPGPAKPQVASSSPGPANPQPASSSPGSAKPQVAPGSPAPASPQVAVCPRSPASPQLGPGRGQAGLFIVVVGWCVMVVEVALDKVGCRRVCGGHRAVVRLRATISDVVCRGRKVPGARGPPTFSVPFPTLG